jgi:hypothetical protein
MPWTLKHGGEVWTGEVHELAGRTYSGRTRTFESCPLVWSEEVEPARSSKGRYKADNPSTQKVDESKVAKRPRKKKVKKNA